MPRALRQFLEAPRARTRTPRPARAAQRIDFLRSPLAGDERGGRGGIGRGCAGREEGDACSAAALGYVRAGGVPRAGVGDGVGWMGFSCLGGGADAA